MVAVRAVGLSVPVHDRVFPVIVAVPTLAVGVPTGSVSSRTSLRLSVTVTGIVPGPLWVTVIR
jgi:hypothetical protein